jgi:hypothetical protein
LVVVNSSLKVTRGLIGIAGWGVRGEDASVALHDGGVCGRRDQR